MAAEPAAGGASAGRREAGGFSPLLFVGFAIASIGGPLALLNFLLQVVHERIILVL